MKRRILLTLLTGLVLPMAACRRDPTVLRLGYSPDLPNMAALVGVTSGRMAKAGNLPVRAVVFSNGPAVTEALVARDIDVAYLDPISAVSAFVRTRGECVIIAGAATGGSALVATAKSKVKTPQDLKMLKVATPAQGNTQDVAARAYFGTLGFVSYEQGGEFDILPVGNPLLLLALNEGQMAAAWTTEPWVSQVEAGGGKIILDEVSVWTAPAGTPTYSTSVLMVRKKLLRRYPALIDDFLRLHVETTKWANAHPAEAQPIAQTAIEAIVRSTFSATVMPRAWPRVRFTTDLPQVTLAKQVDDAARVGFFGLEPLDMGGLIVEEPMKRVVKEPEGAR